MAKVNTVVGPISVEELGIVSVHAHTGHGMPGHELDTNCSQALEQRYGEAVPTLRQFREYGGETLVDATSTHSARDLDYYKLLSARTGVLIVVSAGFDGGTPSGRSSPRQAWTTSPSTSSTKSPSASTVPTPAPASSRLGPAAPAV